MLRASKCSKWWRQMWTVNYSSCQTMEMPQCSAGLYENLMKIQSVGQNFSHFRNLSLKMTVFLDGNDGIAKTNPGLWLNADLVWWLPFPTRNLGSWAGLGLEEQWVLQSHLQVCQLQVRIGASRQSWGAGAGKKGFQGFQGFQVPKGRTWRETGPGPAGSVLHGLTLPGSCVVGSQTSQKEGGQPLQKGSVVGISQAWTLLSCFWVLAVKQRVSIAFTTCTRRETCHSLFSDLPHQRLLNATQLRAGDCKYFPQILCFFSLLLPACLTEQPATVLQHCGKGGDAPPR